MINTDKLIARIEAKIAENEAKAGERVEEWEEFLVQHRAEWFEQWGTPWENAIAEIGRKLDNGEVITDKDIPQSSYGQRERFYSEPYRFADGRDKPRKARVPSEVQQLLDAIGLLGEIEISHTALAKMGCGNQVMSEVSRFLAGR